MKKQKEFSSILNKIEFEEIEHQKFLYNTDIFELACIRDAGYGVTMGLILSGLKYIDFPEYRAVFLRKTTPMLHGIRKHSKLIFPKIDNSCNFFITKDMWKFNSGSTIRLSSTGDRKQKIYDIGSCPYHFIFFDNLQDFEEYEYLYLLTRCRSINKDITPRIRSSINPERLKDKDKWVVDRFLNLEDKKVYKDESTLLEKMVMKYNRKKINT